MISALHSNNAIIERKCPHPAIDVATKGAPMMPVSVLCYGALFVAFPLVTRRNVPFDAFGHVFGRVFTAWGCAGLIGPLMVSALNQWFSGYAAAILVAVAGAALALVFLGSGKILPERKQL